MLNTIKKGLIKMISPTKNKTVIFKDIENYKTFNKLHLFYGFMIFCGGSLIDYFIEESLTTGTIFKQSADIPNFFTFLSFVLMILLVIKKVKSMPKHTKYYARGIKDIFEQNGIFINRGEIKQYPAVAIFETEEDFFLTVYQLTGLPVEKIKKSSDVFQEFIGYMLLKQDQDNRKITLHFKKKEMEITTDYLNYINEKPVLGLNSLYSEIEWNFLQNPHLLIAAKTGGGKTAFLHTIVLQLKEIANEITFVDFKGNEFGPLKRLGYEVFTDMDGLTEKISYYRAKMKETQKLLEEQGKRDFTQLGLKPNFIVIDEFSELINSFGSSKEEKERKGAFLNDLASVMRLGRSSGYYFIISLQQPNAETLPTEIRNNMAQKICVRGADSTIQTMVFGERVSDIPIPLPLGSHITNTENGYEVIKTPYIEDFIERMD